MRVAAGSDIQNSVKYIVGKELPLVFSDVDPHCRVSQCSASLVIHAKPTVYPDTCANVNRTHFHLPRHGDGNVYLAVSLVWKKILWVSRVLDKDAWSVPGRKRWPESFIASAKLSVLSRGRCNAESTTRHRRILMETVSTKQSGPTPPHRHLCFCTKTDHQVTSRRRDMPVKA